MNGVGQRFYQRGFYKRERSGNPEDTTGRGRYKFRKRPVEIQPIYLPGRAQVLALGCAIRARSAAGDGIDGNCFTRPKAHTIRSADQFAAEFVTQDQRWNALLASPEESVEVGTAHPGGTHPYQDLAGFRHRVREVEHFQAVRRYVDQ